MCDNHDRHGHDHCCHDHHGHDHHGHDHHSWDDGPEGPPPEFDEGRGDPIEHLKDSLFEITEEAFFDLIAEKVAERIEAKMGKRLDEIADAVVDHYLAQREAEVAFFQRESGFNDKLEKALRKKE